MSAPSLLRALALWDKAEKTEASAIESLKASILAAVEAKDLQRARADLDRLRGIVDEAAAKPLVLKVSVLELTETMVLIPAGEFEMGGGPSGNGMPVHTVHIERPFFVGRTEVTRGQFMQVMGRDPSRFKDDPNDARFSDDLDLPVEQVSWLDAIDFCIEVSRREGLSPRYRLVQVRRTESGILTDAVVELVEGSGYRLPTEAEWEYACRAGTTTAFSFGEEDAADAHMWYGGNAGGQTRLVATRKTNPWGRHDMHGNVGEWVEDVWHDSYDGAPLDGSAWMTGGSPEARVAHGGAWGLPPELCRAAFRIKTLRDYRTYAIGFRVALDPP
jgi:formylglycine-generating enzyme required for sulfatase activity